MVNTGGETAGEDRGPRKGRLIAKDVPEAVARAQRSAQRLEAGVIGIQIESGRDCRCFSRVSKKPADQGRGA